METITYEEDLQTNPLYIKLIDKPSLLEEITLNSWIIVLPKRSSFCVKSDLNTHEFMLSHILTPSEELPKSHFYNLLGDSVLINGNNITMKETSTKILFEEYFYTKDSRYKIICINRPLSTKFSNNMATTCSNSVVKNVKESLDFIHHKCSKYIERKIDNGIKNFNSRIQNVNDYESLQRNTTLLYDYCVNISCVRKVKDDPFICMNLKLALEYILMDSIYDKIFDAIIIKYADENEKFNKIVKRLSNITLNDLNVSSHISSEILKNLNVIRNEILKIDSNCKTSLDKLSCIKNVIDLISTYIGSVTTDILLPILVFLLIKSHYYLWIPTLQFIKQFNLSSILNVENQSSGSALFYILTTLEAIIYFIQTNENISMENDKLFPSKSIEDIKCKDDYLSYLFELTKDNNELEFGKLINISYEKFKNNKASQETKETSCHPLCRCTQCEAKNFINDSSSLNVNEMSKDMLTMLHVASAYNNPKIVSTLINLGADVNSKDIRGWTPLHYASQKGHQKVLFLLLHNQKDSINLRNNHEQTALILAAMYGHEQCVKALLFFAEHTHTSIDINRQDIDGMTALHYAVQHCYDGIVENLIEYLAKVTITNHIGKIPIDYARNPILKKKLEDAAKYQVEELPITENEFIFLRKDDLADIFQEIS